MKHFVCHYFIYRLCSCQVPDNLLWSLPAFCLQWEKVMDVLSWFHAYNHLFCLGTAGADVVWTVCGCQQVKWGICCSVSRFPGLLTRAPDGAHLRDLSQSPAASRVAAALHLGVLAGQLGSAASVSQSRETGAHTLIWGRGDAFAGWDESAGSKADKFKLKRPSHWSQIRKMHMSDVSHYVSCVSCYSHEKTVVR